MRTFSIFACLAGLSLPDVIYSAHLTIFHDMFDEFNPLGLFSILFGMMIPSGSYFGSWSNESLTPMGATQCRHVNANRACLVVQHWWPNPNVLEVSSPKPGRLAKRKRRSYLATSRCMYIYIYTHKLYAFTFTEWWFLLILLPLIRIQRDWTIHESIWSGAMTFGDGNVALKENSSRWFLDGQTNSIIG